MSAASDKTSSEPASNRLPLLVAVLVGVEAVMLLAAAVFLVAQAVASDRGNLAAGISLAAITIAVGAGLAVCARGVASRLRWTRGPVFTWQLLQAGVGMPLSTSRAWWAGVPLLAISIVVGVLIAGRWVITEPSDQP
jgi:hypothetical protein